MNFQHKIKMGSKFERNNLISDSDSDPETPDKAKDNYNISFKDSILVSPSNSESSIIESSYLDVSKIQSDSPRRVIEESATEDGSSLHERSISTTAAHLSNLEVEYVASFSRISSQKCSIKSSSDEDEIEICKEVIDLSDDDEAERSFTESENISIDSPSPNSNRESFDEISNYGSSDSMEKSRSGVNLGKVDRSVLEKQRIEKEAVYQSVTKAVYSCDLRKLKDGGKLLLEKMKRCKEELDELTERLKNLPITHHESPALEKSEMYSLFSNVDPHVRNLGEKALKTHRREAALTMDAVTRIHESLKTCPNQNTFEKDPHGLKIKLMQHQTHALAWLLWREKQIPPGGILADDMGLGKTLSIIALVLRSREYKTENNNGDEKEAEQGSVQVVDGIRTYKGKTLVVCPASLVGQWEQQIHTHCKENILSVTIHHGRTRNTPPKRLAGYDVVITTYGVLAEENKRKGDVKTGFLFRIQWERIVLDEAHVIRNHKTQKAVAACELLGSYRWCLTGTPVHNKQRDLYSLLKFLRCSPFDDQNVWKRWVENKGASGVQRVKTVIKAILLRRTKEDLTKQGQLTDLPNKNFISVYVDLDEEELKVYHEVLTFSKSLLAEYLQLSKFRSEGGKNNIEQIRNHLKGAEDVKATDVFVLLLRLRQICCIPGLIHSFLERESCLESGIEPDDPIVEDLYSQLSRMSIGAPRHVKEVYNTDKMKTVLHKSNPVFEMERASTKIQALLNVIKEVLPTNDKIVIVSQWTKVLKKLETHIRLLKVKSVSLDGNVPVASRSTIIEQFNRPDNNIRIMLLSLNAGGVGLNLTGGNRLVIFEPHWNPQLESQACDRIYRVGQKKQVFVYKILCKGTIEEKIELLQKQKLELANNLLREDDGSFLSQMKQLTLNDLATLFDV